MTKDTDGSGRIHLAEDTPEPEIAFRFDDALAFAIFWALAIIVFLQFFTRYVLNDSYSWTEEIARYLLMWVTFVGGAVAMRRGTHISVEFAHHFLPPGAVRVLNFLIDLVVVGFIGLLCWFAIAITQRMHIQTMTVLPVSGSMRLHSRCWES